MTKTDFGSPHGHPGFRERGTYTQKQWDEIKRREADNAAQHDERLSQDVKNDCENMIAELDATDKPLWRWRPDNCDFCPLCCWGWTRVQINEREAPCQGCGRRTAYA